LVEFPQDLDGVSAYSSHEIEELYDIDSAFNLGSGPRPGNRRYDNFCKNIFYTVDHRNTARKELLERRVS
jgi:hypothetical protein